MVFVNLVFPHAKSQQGERDKLFTLVHGGKMKGNRHDFNFKSNFN